MEEFNLDRVEKLFKSNGLKAKENCYFVALKDSRKNQGLIGGANYPYSGLLLDVTEKGIGMFYLKTNKMAFRLDTSKVSIEEDKLSYLYSSVRSVIIIFNTGPFLCFISRRFWC